MDQPTETSASPPDPLLHGVSLSRYAAAQAALAEGLELEAVLANEGIDPVSWPKAESAWSNRLLDDLEQDGTLQEAFDDHLAAAQDRYGRSIPPLNDDLKAWLDLIRRWSAAPEPLAFLAQLHLRPTDLIRLQRSWSQRMALDPELARTAQQLLQQEPGELPTLNPEPYALVLRRVPRAPAPPSPTAEADEARILPARSVADEANEEIIETTADKEPALFSRMPHLPPEELSQPLNPPVLEREQAMPPAPAPLPTEPIHVAREFPDLKPPSIVQDVPPRPVRASHVPVETVTFSLAELGMAADASALPFVPASGSAPQSTRPMAPLHPRPVLPFQEAKTPPPRSSSERKDADDAHEEGTKQLDEHPSKPELHGVTTGPLPPGIIAAALPFTRSTTAGAEEAIRKSSPAPSPPTAPKHDDPSLTTTGPLPICIPSLELPFEQPAGAGHEAQAGERSAPLPSAPDPSSGGLPVVLTLSQYAALCAELAVMPQSAEQTFSRYGLASAQDRQAVDRAWQERLRTNPAEYQQWQELYRRYHGYLSEQTRRG